MIESLADVLIGMVFGIAGTIIVALAFSMLKMNFKFMVWNKIREHEDKFHAEEVKEKLDKKGVKKY